MSSASTSASDARRKAEIEAKKAKLLEIRRQREERAQRLKSTSTTLQQQQDPSATASASRKDLDDLVNSLISGSGSATPATQPRSSRASIVGSSEYPSSPRKSLVSRASGVDPPSSEFGGSESEGIPATAPTTSTSTAPAAAASRAYLPELIEVETELYELPQKQRVYYTKEVQASVGVGSSDEDEDDLHRTNRGDAGGVGTETRVRETEESLRAKILAEQAEEVAARKEEERLEREIAEQLRELTDEERTAIYSAQDFSDFVEQSSKIVERALADTYDYMRDYRIAADSSNDLNSTAAGSQLRLLRTFAPASINKMFENRSITALDWSKKFPELCVAAYNRNDQNEDFPDGLVAIWNLHLLDRPEFIFHAPTDVVSVCFSPFHPNLVIGGTYSGQILIWDTTSKTTNRSQSATVAANKHLPVLKTPLSAAGHTHPVYNLKIIGSLNAHNLVSASTDGTVCFWMMDMLAKPQEVLELVNTIHPKTDEVSITSLGVRDQETTSFLVGTEEGNIYSANRYDRAGFKAGLNLTQEIYKSHLAPVTAIDFHPLNLNGNVDFSDLFLSSSMDWTCKLWRLKPAHQHTQHSSLASSNSNSSINNASVSMSRSSNARSSYNASTSATTNSAASSGVMQSPILNFEESNDYIYDVKWCPTHPAVFAMVDGTGRLDIFNLNVDTERPVVSMYPGEDADGVSKSTDRGSTANGGETNGGVDNSSSTAGGSNANGVGNFESVGDQGRALNKLSWSSNGKHLALANSKGTLYIYELKDSIVGSTQDDFDTFQNVVAKLLLTSSTSPQTGGPGTAAGNSAGYHSSTRY